MPVFTLQVIKLKANGSRFESGIPDSASYHLSSPKHVLWVSDYQFSYLQSRCHKSSCQHKTRVTTEWTYHSNHCVWHPGKHSVNVPLLTYTSIFLKTAISTGWRKPQCKDMLVIACNGWSVVRTGCHLSRNAHVETMLKLSWKERVCVCAVCVCVCVCDVLLCGYMGGKGKWRVGGDQSFLLILENNIVNCKLN